MQLSAIDATTLRLLMVAGAIFAAVGLLLLLKPRGEGTAKVELLGMKFESSSAGVLVFLIGAVFLAVPLLVPEKAGGPLATRPDVPQVNEQGAGGNPSPKSGTAPGASDVADGAGGARALILPEEGAEEEESNDTVHEANQVAFGATVRGFGASDDKIDWYVIPMADADPVVTLGLRLMEGSQVRASVYDALERRLGELGTRSGVAYADYELDNTDRLYVQVEPYWGSRTTYEVFTRAGEAPGAD